MGNQPGQPGGVPHNGPSTAQHRTGASSGSRPATASPAKGVAKRSGASTPSSSSSSLSSVSPNLAVLKFDTVNRSGATILRATKSTIPQPYSHQVWLHVWFNTTDDPLALPPAGAEHQVQIINKTVDGRIKANEISLTRVRDPSVEGVDKDWYFIAALGALSTDEVKVWCIPPSFRVPITAGVRFDWLSGRLYRYQQYGLMTLPDNGLMVIDMNTGVIQSLRPAMPDSKTVMWPLEQTIALHKSEAKVDHPYFLDVLAVLPSQLQPSLPTLSSPIINVICSYIDDVVGQVMEAKTRFPLRLYESVRILCPDLIGNANVSPLTLGHTHPNYLTLAMHPITAAPHQWSKDHCQLLVKVPSYTNAAGITTGGHTHWMDIRKSKVRAMVPVSPSWDANISVECYALELSVTFTEAVTLNHNVNTSTGSNGRVERVWAATRDVRWLADDAKLLVTPLTSSDATSISGQVEHEPLAAAVVGDEPPANSHLWKLPELDFPVFPLQLLPTTYVIKLGAAATANTSSASASKDNGRLYTLTTTKQCKPVSKWPCTRPSCVLCGSK